jgi:hypothetical protein
MFFHLQPRKSFALPRGPCHGGTKSKKQVTVLLACNTDTDVSGKHGSLYRLRNVKKRPTKYNANSNSWVTTIIFEDCLTQLDGKMGAKLKKSLF